jgi:hypothetical protein
MAHGDPREGKWRETDERIGWPVLFTLPRNIVYPALDCAWNVMAHTQKPDFFFRRKGRAHLNRRGRQFSRLLAAELCASAIVMLDKPRSELVWECWLLTQFASFPFTSPSVRHRVPSGFKRTLLPLMRTPRLPVFSTDTPADLNGLVRFTERRNLVSARVPSYFKRSLLFAQEPGLASGPIWTRSENLNPSWIISRGPPGRSE